MIKSKIIFATAVGFILISNICAQTGKISGDIFSSVTEKAVEKSRVFPIRHILTEETYKNENLVKTATFIWEAVSDEKNRIVRTEKIGESLTKLEEINIGSDVYKRENDGAWRKEEWRFKDSPGRRTTVILGCEEYSVKDATFENQNVRVFEQFFINKDNAALMYEQEDFWINRDGRLLKQETTYGLLNPRNVIWRKIIVYEYDANIKIEAPVK